jgi:hypothetical protein
MVVHKKIVLIIIGLWLWNDVFLGMKGSCRKKQGAASHFRLMGDQTRLLNLSI